MNKKIIKRSISSFFTSISGIAGVWLYILFFSDRNSGTVFGGIIGSVIMGVVIYAAWCKSIVLGGEIHSANK